MTSKATATKMEEMVKESIASMDISDEATSKHRAKINQERLSAGLGPLPREPSEAKRNEPNIPCCDACGAEFAGTLECSACRSAFYCSKACQKAAWKGGHKAACPNMEEQCKQMGIDVVSQMKDESMPPVLRMQGLERLDGAGAFRSAVRNGLYEVLRGLFQSDVESVLERYQSGDRFKSTSYWIMMVLFRGQRVSRADCEVFGKMDGGRIKGYVLSHPKAFDVWFEAASALAMVPLHNSIANGLREAHLEVHQAARDVWSGLSQVFTNERASRAILFKSKAMEGEESNKASEERAKWIASKLVVGMRALDNAREGRDINDVIEAYHYQLAAMLSYRCREYEIDIDFEKLLNLRSIKLQMYKQMAVPLGEATIKKGFPLNNLETQAAMQEYARRPRRKGMK